MTRWLFTAIGRDGGGEPKPLPVRRAPEVCLFSTRRRTHMGRCLIAVVAGGLLLSLTSPARAEELPKKYQEMADRGLEWLAKQQFRDGHWEAAGGQFATAMTGVAGTTLLMEGSTMREGKYADNI